MCFEQDRYVQYHPSWWSVIADLLASHLSSGFLHNHGSWTSCYFVGENTLDLFSGTRYYGLWRRRHNVHVNHLGIGAVK